MLSIYLNKVQGPKTCALQGYMVLSANPFLRYIGSPVTDKSNPSGAAIAICLYALPQICPRVGVGVPCTGGSLLCHTSMHALK